MALSLLADVAAEVYLAGTAKKPDAAAGPTCVVCVECKRCWWPAVADAELDAQM